MANLDLQQRFKNITDAFDITTPTPGTRVVGEIGGEYVRGFHVVAGIAFTASVGRLVQQVRRLAYGPELGRHAQNLKKRMEPLMEVRHALPANVLQTLEELERQIVKLIQDINSHYAKTNGARAMGAAAGTAGAACAIASCVAPKAKEAATLMQVGAGLGAANLGIEVVAEVADWFAGYQERLNVLAHQLERATKDTLHSLTHVRVRAAQVVANRTEVRVDGMDTAQSILAMGSAYGLKAK